MTQSFLQKIHGDTLTRVAASKTATPENMLKEMPFFNRQAHDAASVFRNDDINIIAEVKFASPSEGDILPGGDPVHVAGGYLAGGARMLSILTEPAYFKGDLDYLRRVREAFPSAVLLRKDFILDPYQLTEAKAFGADAVLLIVAFIEAGLMRDLFAQAKDLGLTPLVEVHDAVELDAALAIGADFIGVNNRNLKTLKTDLEVGRSLAARKLPESVFICESGLKTSEDIRAMRTAGYDGFLIGTHFMRQSDPGAALRAMKEAACG